MKPKHLVRRIVLAVVALILVAVMIVANYYLNYYSVILHSFFADDTASAGGGGEAGDELEYADQVIRNSAAESMVLLKNDDNFLPQRDLTKVNLFGWGSTDYGFILTGGGSGGTTILDSYSDDSGNDVEKVKVDLTDAFLEAGIEYNVELNAAYENFSKYDADYRSGGTTGANAVESLLNPDASFYSEALMNNAYNYSDVAVAVLSRFGAENGGSQELVNISSNNNGTYNNGTFLELTANEKAMFDALQAKNFKVIVLLNVCNNIELSFLEDYSCIKSCLFVGIPGQSGAAAIPQIIVGDINPSGRTSDTLAYDYQTNNPVYANAYVSNSNLVYQEGIYFGYKWYETADAEGYFDSVSNKYGTGYDGVVQYPFGYGLSYTTFGWNIVTAESKLGTTLNADSEYTVVVEVTNTGDVAGKDVVQLYGHAPYTNGGIEKAERVLLDFEKTPVLYPTSEADAEHPNSCKVELKFTAYDMASYDDYDKNGNGFCGYELDGGEYEFYVMPNAHDTSKNLSFRLNLNGNLRYEEDPETGEVVGNLFTGSDAYLNCPIDGGVTYLSRANKFANFPTARATVNSSGVSDVVYHGYDNMQVSYSYGANYGLYLVQVKNTDEEGNVTYTRATPEMLTGEDTSVELAYNTEVIELLLDYDSEIWDLFLDQLTQDEIKQLIGLGGFQTAAVYSIGKPLCTDKDGPAGFNNNVSKPGKASVYPLFPSESLLGCSWSKQVAHDIGDAQAKVAQRFGINGWYGPGVNLHRSVYNSRNYEYFSEDAVLSGKLATQTILAAKEGNLYCYIKHFAVSEAGQNPKNVNTWLNEQALRESYLRAFEIPVKQGEANAVMSAFNCVGAVLSGYNHALLTDVLRNEWGFRGSVITDWFEGSGYMENHKAGVLAGNDLWLCGTTEMAARIDLNDPAVAYAARRSVKNIIYTFITTNATATSITVNAAPHSALVDAMVIGLNVVLGLGIAVCVLFAVLPSRKKKAAEESVETQE